MSDLSLKIKMKDFRVEISGSTQSVLDALEVCRDIRRGAPQIMTTETEAEPKPKLSGIGRRILDLAQERSAAKADNSPDGESLDQVISPAPIAPKTLKQMVSNAVATKVIPPQIKTQDDEAVLVPINEAETRTEFHVEIRGSNALTVMDYTNPHGLTFMVPHKPLTELQAKTLAVLRGLATPNGNSPAIVSHRVGNIADRLNINSGILVSRLKALQKKQYIKRVSDVIWVL